MRHALGALALALALGTPRGARADLRDAAARVAQAWTAAGGTVSRGPSRFILEDDAVVVDVGGHEGDCRQVAFIGAPGMSFHVATDDDDDDDAGRVASVAGILELQGCAGSVPDRIRIKGDAGRGALETVFAAASGSLPPLRSILLERTGGVLPRPPEPGALPPLPPPETRGRAAAGHMVREGFTVDAPRVWTSGTDGKGNGSFVLDAGCHRFDLFAREPRGARSHLDLDGSVRGDDGAVLAEDQTSAPDVHLDVCVSIVRRVVVSFEGAPRGSPVVVVHGAHDLPDHLPALWGPEPRARFAAALFAHHLAGPPDDAVLLAQGASGDLPIPFEVEPGACYTAVATLERGRGHGIGVSATVGPRLVVDERGAKDAAIVAFCAKEARHATLEVDARSAGSGWALAVFRMQGGVWSLSP